MEDVFRFSDDFGPARIICICKPSLALKAILVIGNTACGPAIGGLNRWTQGTALEKPEARSVGALAEGFQNRSKMRGW